MSFFLNFVIYLTISTGLSTLPVTATSSSTDSAYFTLLHIPHISPKNNHGSDRFINKVFTTERKGQGETSSSTTKELKLESTLSLETIDEILSSDACTSSSGGSSACWPSSFQYPVMNPVTEEMEGISLYSTNNNVDDDKGGGHINSDLIQLACSDENGGKSKSTSSSTPNQGGEDNTDADISQSLIGSFDTLKEGLEYEYNSLVLGSKGWSFDGRSSSSSTSSSSSASSSSLLELKSPPTVTPIDNTPLSLIQRSMIENEKTEKPRNNTISDSTSSSTLELHLEENEKEKPQTPSCDSSLIPSIDLLNPRDRNILVVMPKTSSSSISSLKGSTGGTGSTFLPTSSATNLQVLTYDTGAPTNLDRGREEVLRKISSSSSTKVCTKDKSSKSKSSSSKHNNNPNNAFITHLKPIADSIDSRTGIDLSQLKLSTGSTASSSSSVQIGK